MNISLNSSSLEFQASVLQLEQRSLNAWSAPRTLLMDDWALRFAGGYTKRANSINAMQVGARLDEKLLNTMEQLYADQDQPCIFRLSLLADSNVDTLLHEHGYQLQDPSFMLQRSLKPEDISGPQLQVQSSLNADWFEGVCAANALQEPQRQWHQRILQTIGLRCAYVSLEREGHAVAWALAVMERGAVGLYDVVVEPTMRGQGLGRQLMQGLLRWAAGQAVTTVDLQVAGSNVAAQALYASLGFERVYGYHYRVNARA